MDIFDLIEGGIACTCHTFEMKNQPLYLKLVKQVLGSDYSDLPVDKYHIDSPYPEYRPHQYILRSRILPEDQATQLKVSTLSQNNKITLDVVIPQQQVQDLFEDIVQEQPNQEIQSQSQQYTQQQQTAQQVAQMCCQMNPLQGLSKYQLSNNVTDQQIIQNFIDFIPDQIQQIAIHPQGNFVFQKLYQSASVAQRLQLLKNLNIYELSLSQHGTRSVQKIILIANESEIQQEIAKQFKTRIVELILNAHGNHCVQKILDTFKSDQFDFIVEECCSQLLKVSCHQHGCCVLQRCLDHCNQEQFDKIFKLVKQYAYQLVVDQYGNYVYQFLLDCNQLTDDEINQLIQQLYGREAELTRMKSSSHVIEKCLTKGSSSVVKQIINNLVDGDNQFVELCCDRYANYVIQKILAVASEAQMAKIRRIVEENEDRIGQSQFSRHIVSFVFREQ